MAILSVETELALGTIRVNLILVHFFFNIFAGADPEGGTGACVGFPYL